MIRIIRSLLFVLLSITAFLFCEVKNVILVIGDGMGLAIIDLARIVIVGKEGYLSFEKFPVVGIVKTYSGESLVTDSAAAATAMSCGVKTKNSFLGLTVDGEIVEHLIDKVKKTGRAAGLVTTVTITHATPAGFVVNIDTRDERQVVQQYSRYKNVDVLLGGGKFVYPVVREFEKEYTIVRTRDELLNLNIEKTFKLLGVFKNIEGVFYIDRIFFNKNDIPTLEEMSKVAVELLSKNPKGFFLMIEAGRIDWACHDNDAATAVYEIKELDDAIVGILQLLREKKIFDDTLVIVTSDHETGGVSLGTGEYGFYPERIKQQKVSIKTIVDTLKGKPKKIIVQKFAEYTGIEDLTDEEIDAISKGDRFAVSKIISSRAEIGWSTKVHSGMSVPLYAIGKHAEVFSGVYENTDIHKKLVQVMNLK